MNRLKILRTALVVACACGAVLATGAAAEEYEVSELPEIGRCLPASPAKTGQFKGKKCSMSAPGKGTTNWFHGAGPKPKFTNLIESPVLETTGPKRQQIKCSFGESEGEYVNPKVIKIKTLDLKLCLTPAPTALEEKCQNIGSALGEIKFNELRGTVGFIEKAHVKVGYDLQAASGGALVTFECGGGNAITEVGMGTGKLMEVNGSVIGRLKKRGVMSSENVVFYVAKGSKQVPEKFEGGVNDTLTTLEGLEKTPEPTTYSATEEVVNEEPNEVKVKCTGPGC